MQLKGHQKKALPFPKTSLGISSVMVFNVATQRLELSIIQEVKPNCF